MRSPLRWLLPALVSTTAFVACSVDEGAAGAAFPVARVRYELDWDDGRATRDVGGGFVTVTDLGIVVRVSTGYVTSFTTSLVACAPASTGVFESAQLGVRLGVRAAWAGHAFGDEPSTLEDPLVEDVVDGGPVVFGALAFAEGSYCQAHYALGAAPVGARESPTGVSMIGSTLLLVGTFERPGELPESFTYVTPVADGRLVDLAAIAPDDGTVGTTLTLRIVRDRGSLFDGVTFEGAGGGDATLAAADEKQLLTNLVEGARFEATPS